MVGKHGEATEAGAVEQCRAVVGRPQDRGQVLLGQWAARTEPSETAAPLPQRGGGRHLERAWGGQSAGCRGRGGRQCPGVGQDRKSTRLNSSHVSISYAV